MGKKSKSQSKSAPEAPANGGLPFLGSATLDAGLSSLFEKSAGPVKTPTVKYVEFKPRKQVKETDDVAELEEEAESENEVMEDAAEDSAEGSESEAEEKVADTQSRKRKRGGAEDDLEASYMRRIEKEEQRAEDKRNAEQAKRQKPTEYGDDESDASEAEAEEDAESEDSDDDEEEEDEEAGEKEPVPVHESVSGSSKASEVEKSNRTVFLGNVSTEAIKSKAGKKTLLRHLASFCSDLPEASGPHKIESIRFRSVPFASGGGIPKRASFARREILDDTSHSTNAYAVYTTVQAARKAPAALNGTIVLDRHLRVDSIAHPAAIDNKRCVFVGNLDFVDQEVAGEDENGKKKKPRKPSDIEEGLWRVFNAHTGDTKDKKAVKKNVEFVRVIRDQNTRVGKGFAYVQFYDGTNVEQALVLNEKNFPPLLPRKIRVARARKVMKRRDDAGGKGARAGDLAHKTAQGRAGKLLGRAAASKMKTEGKGGIAGNSFVFEGHRASEGGSSTLKVKVKSRGSKGKPKNRSSKRAAAYRAAGGQRP